MKFIIFILFIVVFFTSACFGQESAPVAAAWYVKAFQWITANYGNVFLAIAGLVGVAEIVVRMTPTKKDDSAVERIGKILKSIMDFLKIPNVKK